ncbi:MAG: phosphoribosylformylglycinamidine cyclo-ligase [Candidatus Cloacimonetes bacterium]|nr:phosphoribosylformylglycinamidine cyclo-ligase [Candidatus Cloacimonadota bacterium]
MDHLKKPMDYKAAGVDIAAGEAAVKAIKDKVRSTYNKNVLGDLGSFGGLYQIDQAAWKQPILVSSTDGVGTKLRVAIMAGEYGTIGQDLVNHCVNDILVQGALPQFFLDYIGVGILEPHKIEKIIDGLVKACLENGCALIGGEMAEMPGIYQAEDFDLAGTIVGMVEKEQLLPRNSIQATDMLVALPSSGLHTNGYSLVRKIIFEMNKLSLDAYIEECQATLGELLLSVHRSYLPALRSWLASPALHGLAHITGGGIAGNLKRILPSGIGAWINLTDDRIPALFHWLQSAGKIQDSVMRQAFNLGVGMIAVVEESSAVDFAAKTNGWILGSLEAAAITVPQVRFL